MIRQSKLEEQRLSMSDIFYRVYVDAINSGMVADMGADNWQTLSVLASFMDAKGECYPSQETIGARLNISREAANRRVGKLLRYQWHGRPIVTSRKNRDPAMQKWQNTIYTIMPDSGIRIFETSHGERHTVKPHMAPLHTNDIQF